MYIHVDSFMVIVFCRMVHIRTYPARYSKFDMINAVKQKTMKVSVDAAKLEFCNQHCMTISRQIIELVLGHLQCWPQRRRRKLLLYISCKFYKILVLDFQKNYRYCYL